MTIEYDGTRFHGWQSQINALAVQDVVTAAIRKLTGEEEISLIGCSRTDTGVHAYGQVANFHTGSRIPADKFAYALNHLLPEDVVVRKSEEMYEGFHSRFSAKGKKYRYLIHNTQFPSALLQHRAYHTPYPMDFEKMHEAAAHFVGTHDFAAFQATGSNAKTTVRTVTEIRLDKNENTICMEIAGNGFLYNMVRIIAGTLVYVGMGKIAPEDIPSIIAGGDRTRAGITAPAHGLYLVEIYY